MNAVTPVPPDAPPAPPAPAGSAQPGLSILPHAQDRDFLPAALAIIETPASPIKIILMLTICVFAALALLWSWFGEIDIHANAHGKVEPAGHSKVIQPLETGKVTELAAANGRLVKAGDVLLRLDPREAQADLQAATAAASAAKAEALRRAVAMEGVRAAAATGSEDQAAAIDAIPAIAWPDDIPLATRSREEGVLRSDLKELAATLANLADQEKEKQAAVAQLARSIEAERQLQDVQEQRVTMKQTLFDKSFGSKTDLLDAMQTLRATQAQIVSDAGKEDQAKAALASLQSERRRTLETFLSDQSRKMADARRTADEKEAEQAKAGARLDRMILTAPIDGVVQALAVTTQGQVVNSGQEVMRIVPVGGDGASTVPIEIQAYVTNEDIGFVTPGQDAVIKIDSFPFTRYGTVAGAVLSVASDAIPADQANEALSDVTRSSDRASQALTPTARPITDLVFETHIKPASPSIVVNGKPVLLSPGMTVTVEIRTGSRRILEYLFSPLVEVAQTAMRER